MDEVEAAGGGGSGVKLGGNRHSFRASLFAKLEGMWGKRHKGANPFSSLSKRISNRGLKKSGQAASHETASSCLTCDEC